MNPKKHLLPAILGSIGLFLLITDPETALSGASAGIEQCIRVIIPSLFPYFFITSYLNSWLLGMRIPGIHQLAQTLCLPDGGDSILLLGLIGGYPVGAKTIRSTYQCGVISRDCAHILLGYCNNAGPAFIFGVTAGLFSSKVIPWLVWTTQVLATVATGLLLPKPASSQISWQDNTGMTTVAALQKSLGSITSVCGWIILFKVLLSYIFKLVGHTGIQVLFAGMLELSNGCLALSEVQAESIRFILCNIFLSFGGLCVFMQTKTVVGDLGLGYYLPGKIMQTSISCLLSTLFSYIIFDKTHPVFGLMTPVVFGCGCLILLITRYSRKKLWNFHAT